MRIESLYRRIIPLSFVVTLAAAENVAMAQQTPRSDTTAAAHAGSRLRAIGEFLLPEVGMVVGHAVSGDDGAFTGFAIGAVVGATMAFVDAHRASAHPAGGRLCLVPGSTGTTDIVIPGTPPTPPIGDMRGSPGTPDITIPGVPGTPDHWEVCR